MTNIQITNYRVEDYKSGVYTLHRTKCTVHYNYLSLEISKDGEWSIGDLENYVTTFMEVKA